MTSGAIIVAEASFFSMSVEFFPLDHKTKVNIEIYVKSFKRRKQGNYYLIKKIYF